MELNKNELQVINGGAKISATYINAISRGISVIYDLGKAVGSAVRYAISGKKC